MSAMGSLVRFRRAAAGAAALGLSCTLAAACGAAHKHAAGLTQGASPAVNSGSSPTAEASTTSVPGSPGSSVAAATTTTVAKKSGTAGAPQTGGAGSGSGSGAPGPAAPGKYIVDQSGGVTAGVYQSSNPPQGTLVIDPVQPNGVQMSHRYISSNSQPSDTATQYSANGPYILSTSEQGPQGNTTCTFNPPIPAPPWPTSAGQTFNSQGSCGSFSVSVQGRVAGTQTDTLKDGETFTVWVINSTLTISGSITGSGTQVDWYSPALRLPLHEQVDMNGTYSGVSFKLHNVSDLESSHPS